MLITTLKNDDLMSVLESNGLPPTQENQQLVMDFLGDQVQQQMRFYAMASLSLEVRKHKNLFLNSDYYTKMIGSFSLDEILGLAEMEFKDIIENEFSILFVGVKNPTFIDLVENPLAYDEKYLSAFERTVHHVIEAVACGFIQERHYHTSEECIDSKYSDIQIEYDELEKVYNYECLTTLYYQINKRNFLYSINVKFDNRAFHQEIACQQFIKNIEKTTNVEIKKEMSNFH
ncbi:hypothetical protein [Bacillus atrophaeus]|uniref:hypothetical protein n=1 Tax=Bacillus atrophaeus TaxID=1452 RepID=UPI002E222A8E|nr:hypothetical protein [Bacillus atrophaeus]MED1032537.1 hypothetical protein [Bacillus atrophaeus]MED1121060.1 hypothetical protein [Bacillus atrophaeus]